MISRCFDVWKRSLSFRLCQINWNMANKNETHSYAIHFSVLLFSRDIHEFSELIVIWKWRFHSKWENKRIFNLFAIFWHFLASFMKFVLKFSFKIFVCNSFIVSDSVEIVNVFVYVIKNLFWFFLNDELHVKCTILFSVQANSGVI